MRRSQQPGSAAAQAERDEAVLELARDEFVIGADQMQHLDAVAAARHGAARREGDRERRREQHEHDDRDAGDDDGVCHRREPAQPETVIVERGRRHLAPQGLAEGDEVVRHGCVEAQHDQPRHRHASVPNP